MHAHKIHSSVSGVPQYPSNDTFRQPERASKSPCTSPIATTRSAVGKTVCTSSSSMSCNPLKHTQVFPFSEAGFYQAGMQERLLAKSAVDCHPACCINAPLALEGSTERRGAGMQHTPAHLHQRSPWCGGLRKDRSEFSTPRASAPPLNRPVQHQNQCGRNFSATTTV
jgi:hypothetical protein